MPNLQGRPHNFIIPAKRRACASKKVRIGIRGHPVRRRSKRSVSHRKGHRSACRQQRHRGRLARRSEQGTYLSPPFILDYGHIIGIGQKTSGNRTSLIIHTSQTIHQTISYIAGITQESLTGISELRFIRFVRPCSRWRLLEPIIREIRSSCVPKKVRIWKRSSSPRTLFIEPPATDSAIAARTSSQTRIASGSMRHSTA